ncbi:MAG: hypothetical protein ACRDAU_19220 [Clostridium sp.]
MLENKDVDLLRDRLSNIEIEKSEKIFRELNKLDGKKFDLNKKSLRVYEIIDKSLGKSKWITK